MPRAVYALALCALLAVWPCAGLPTNVTVLIGSSLMDKGADAALPGIVAYANSVVIPGGSASHYSYDPVHIDGFNIAAIPITFDSPNTVSVGISGLTLQIPQTGFSLFTKILGVRISCSGVLWGSLAPTTGTVSMVVSAVDGRLHFSDPTPMVGWGVLTVGHKFSHETCRIADKILEALIGDVNQKIESVIRNEVMTHVGTLVANGMNRATAKLAVNILAQPVVAGSYLALVTSLLPTSGRVLTSTDVSDTLPIPPVLPARDAFLLIPEQTVDSMLTLADRLGLLTKNITIPNLTTDVLKEAFPQLYSACPGCPIEVEVANPVPPTVRFGTDSITIDVPSAMTNLTIVNSATGLYLPVIDMVVQMSLTLNNVTVRSGTDVLYFQLNLESFGLQVVKSNIGPMDGPTIAALVLKVVDTVLLPDWNAKFPGIPMGKELLNPTVSFYDDCLDFGFNVAI